MYTLIIESENSKLSGELKTPKLSDLYEESPLHEKLDDFPLKKLYDNLDYNIIVLKPSEDDWLVLYANNELYGLVSEDFPNFMKGRYYGELFPKFKELKTLNKFQLAYDTGASNEILFKFYKDNSLLFAGHQFCLRQNDLLYFFAKNETQYYRNQEQEKHIFNESPFPTFVINKTKDIVDANPSFLDLVRFSIDELNLIGVDNFIHDFTPTIGDADNFNDAADLIFNKEVSVFDYQGKFITENKDFKWFSVHMRLKSDDLIEVVSKDITDLKKAERNNGILGLYLEDLQKETKTVVVVNDEEGFHWTDEIFNILEIPEEKRIKDSKENILLNYIITEDKENVLNLIQKLSSDNPVTFDYRIKTYTGKIKYLRTTVKNHFTGENNVNVGFIQDVTDESLAKNNVKKLSNELNTFQRNSNVIMYTFKNGVYSFSPEVYDILELNPEDYPLNTDILKEFATNEQREKFIKLLHELSPDNSRTQLKVDIKNPKGKVKILECFVEAQFDNNDNFNGFITFIHDITEETLAKNSAMKLESSLNSISEFSKIVISSYENGEYKWTPEIYNILKINPEDYGNDVNLIAKFAYPEALKKYEKAYKEFTPENNTFSDIIKVNDSEGELKYLNSKIVIDFDNNNEIKSENVFLEDVTEETLAKNSAIELQESLETIQNTSKIVIITVKDGEYKYTDGIYDMLEINPGDYPSNEALINKFLISEDKYKYEEEIKRFSPENPQYHNIVTVKTPKGNIKVLEGYIVAKYDDDKFDKFVSFVHEITETVKRERELEQLSEDRKILLQEVHHRVKNNLQIITSFLNLESRFNKDKPEYVIEQTRNRINTMALLHEEIYQSPSVSNINLEHFLTTGMNNLFGLYTKGNINLHLNIEPVMVDIDVGIPLGLLINEVALNTIKYAFPKQEDCNFYINLKTLENHIIIKIWDDGVGLPENMDISTSNGLGFIIIRNLTQQLEAELTILEDVQGFGIQLKIPI